jgi:signal transduction histidine kinase
VWPTSWSKNLDRLPRDRVIGYLDRVADTARGLIGFITDLLDLEKIESGALVLERIPLHLDQLLHEAAEQARVGANGRVSLEVAAIATPLVGDPMRLDQVAGNLIANACKFAPAGTTVTVTLTAPTAELVRFEVADRGPRRPTVAHQLMVVDQEDAVNRVESIDRSGSGSTARPPRIVTGRWR